METVLKTAAGVLVGLLAYQIISYQYTDYKIAEYQQQAIHQQAKYEKQRETVLNSHKLKTRYRALSDSIAYYFRKNKRLPNFISDLECINNSFGNIQPGCAALRKEGIFYINHENEWASAKPYIFDDRLYFDCKSTIKLIVSKSRGGTCTTLDIESVPIKKSSTLACRNIVDVVEKLLCASDKLAAIETTLLSTYQDLLEQEHTDKKQVIIDDHKEFIRLRAKACITSACVEDMTTKKISRLQFLGVWSKDQ